MWIRKRDPKCFTCGKPTAHAGHYILRKHMATRFDERNVRGQCAYCNTFLYGNMDVYALRLVDKYGPDILKELNELKNTVKKYTRNEVEGLIETYGL